ncbi:hypothetical protein U1Q18_000752 [Sarracenia purpurea var. burkii]
MTSLQGSSSNGNDVARHDPWVASLFICKDEVVGIKSHRDELVSWLVEGSLKWVAISVVGMGGSDKTTHTKKVYDNPIVTAHFDFHAWIPVSQPFKMEDVLKAIIKQFYQAMKRNAPDQEMDKMDFMSLMEKLKDCLDEKRYVIFFDDVWDQNFWSLVRLALPDNDKGNRVVMTTRNNDVAASCKESQFDRIKELRPLSPDKAWELFCKKAFQADFGGICPSELEDLSRDIVKRCEGLPLALVTIGGVLATKEKVIHQWKTFSDSLGSELGSNPRFKGITRVLSLSYLDLPYHLKLCYLYFGILPNCDSISCTRLIRLWIAEGFVQEKSGSKTLEEVAEEYLNDLIHRSLVQVSWVNISGKVRHCRVHDLMREIIVSISKDSGFCDIFSKENSGFESSDRLTRRLSIHNYTDNFPESIDISRIRSFFCFDENELPESFMGKLVSNFKLLKVLDFEDAPLCFLPKEIGDLIHLSYLSVKNTKTKNLPKSIGRLKNLMILNLKGSLILELPVEINRLYKLRYLRAYSRIEMNEYGLFHQCGVKIQKGFGCLKALWMLSIVQSDHGSDLIKEIRKLTKLRKLGIDKLKSEDGKALCTAIENMSNLQSLDVSSISKDEILDLQHISYPPQFLQNLDLSGRLENFPKWISKLEYVVKISLNYSQLIEDPLKFLQVLPNLLGLRLVGVYAGEHLHFKEGGFQKLQVLELRGLNALSSVRIEDGALPHLQALEIAHIPQLKEVPSGIQHLKEIKVLWFIGMPKDFIDKMLPNGGQDYEIVKHIPNVHFNYEVTCIPIPSIKQVKDMITHPT